MVEVITERWRTRPQPKADTLSKVDIAKPADRAEVERLCINVHKENGLLPLSIKRMSNILDTAFARQGGIVGVIRNEDQKPIAGILLQIEQIYYTESWVLTELFNFVDPDHRRSNYARSLIVFAERCADRLKIPLIIGILSDYRTAAKVRLYEQVLGPSSGAYWVYGRQYAEAAEGEGQ